MQAKGVGMANGLIRTRMRRLRVQRVLLMSWFVFSGRIAAQAPTVAALGTVRGQVREMLGSSVANAEVQWIPGGAVVRTNAEGRYVLSAVPAGRATLRVRRVGFVASQREIDVLAGTPVIVDWQVERAAQQLSSLQVTARRDASDSRLEGFRTRLEARHGGHFITRERIEQSGNRNMLDAFRGIPGVRFGSAGRGGRTVRFRSNSCAPLVFVDGFPASATEFDFESIDLNMVEGIEMYLSSSSVPPDLLGPRGLEQCGVVAIWSRPAPIRTPSIRSTDQRRVQLELQVANGQVMTADQVDAQAALLSGALDVLYPEVLWRTHVNGHATVEFVIDDRGRLDWGTVAVVSATNAEFATAVIEALVGTKWQVARKGSTGVSQLVVLTVAFSSLNPR